jgi:hypothetical protein
VLGGGPVLRLAPALTGDDADNALRGTTRRQLRLQSIALVSADGGRVLDVPKQLDSRRRRVHMLSAGTAGARGSVGQLGAWNGQRVGDEDSVDGGVSHGVTGRGRDRPLGV